MKFEKLLYIQSVSCLRCSAASLELKERKKRVCYGITISLIRMRVFYIIVSTHLFFLFSNHSSWEPTMMELFQAVNTENSRENKTS